METENKEKTTLGLEILLDHLSYEERQKLKADKYRLMVERAKRRYRRRSIYLISLSIASCFAAIIFFGPLLSNQIDNDKLFSKYYEPFDFQTTHRGNTQEPSEFITAVDLFKKSELSQAHEITSDLLVKTPNNPDYLLLLSMILMEQEKYAEAINYLHIISRQGGSFEAIGLWYIGLCRLELEQYDQAEALFKTLRKSGDSKIGKMSKGILKVL
jgi:tetratricopeptide (TPR) repeat protein